MFKVLVINRKSTQENPIEPIEVIVKESDLAACLSKHLTGETYCMVNRVDVFK